MCFCADFIALSCHVTFPKVWDIEAPKTLMIWSPAKQQYLDIVGGFGWGLLCWHFWVVGLLGWDLDWNFSRDNCVIFFSGRNGGSSMNLLLRLILYWFSRWKNCEETMKWSSGRALCLRSGPPGWKSREFQRTPQRWNPRMDRWCI